MDVRLGEGGAAAPQPEENGDWGNYVDEVDALMRAVAAVVRQRGREILKDFDITPPQFNALLELICGGNLTMGELCDRLYLASSTVTDLVDRMEKNGLVERERDPADRRVIRLNVKEYGHRLVGRVMEARKKYLATVLAKLDRERRRQVLDSLRLLHDVMR